MMELPHLDSPMEELPESLSFEAEDCLEMMDMTELTDLELTTSYTPTCDFLDPTPEVTQSSSQENGSFESLTQTSSPHDFQPAECRISSINPTCDAPMSFRDRHRFLHRAYNSHPDPAMITAEAIGHVARKAGLLMEEVLAWFQDEKSRRVELLATNQQSAQKSSSQFPPSPESIRGSGEVSPASSAKSPPGTPSKPQDTSSPGLASVDQSIPSPPKTKRGRPAKTHVKIEPDLPSPDAKRKKMSPKYPCPDCQNYVPAERWAEHINRKHFPKHVWQCPKTNRQTGKSCSSSPHYRPAYRDDNFATHLKGEHDCPDAEVTELKKTCKFEVTDFFHKVCGFESCGISLKTRDESIEHIKDHFRRASEEPNPPVDLGLSLWKERCGVEHKLLLGIHYLRTQSSKLDPTNEDGDRDRDGNNNGASGEGSPDESNHDSSRSRSTTDSSHGQEKGEGNSDNTCQDSSGSQPNNIHAHHDDGDSQFHQEIMDTSGKSEWIDATLSQDQPSIGQSKMNSENAPTLPSISSLLLPPSDARTESSDSEEPQNPAGSPWTRTQKLTTKDDTSFQRYVEACGKVFERSYNLNAHNLKAAHKDTHAETRQHRFPCAVEECNKKFGRMADLERHHQSAHAVQQSRCVNCGRAFAREATLSRHIKDGCSQSVHVETSSGVPIAKTTYYPRGSCKAEVDFPLYPDPTSTFSLNPQSAWSNVGGMYASAPRYEMESPEFTPSPNSSAALFTSTRSSSMASPYSIRTPLYGKGTPSFRTSSNESTASEPSVFSSSMDSPYPYYEHKIPVPEWEPQGLGLNPGIVSYDVSGSGIEYSFLPPEMDDFKLDFNPTKQGFVDPSFLHPQYTSRSPSAANSSYTGYSYPPPSPHSSYTGYSYPREPSLPSHTGYSYQPASPHSSYSHPYPPPSRPSVGASQSSESCFSSEESREKGLCTYPECGKVFKDLKAHMLTHQNARPEKCPIESCDYHIKGFARKYDKNRHTLTHYKGTMVCGFCPGSGSAAEKSFNRADVFKRHLTSVHSVDQTPPNSRRKTTGNIYGGKPLSGYAPDATGKCSTCDSTFDNAQDFYEHLDDCVLRIVQQEDPSEATNAKRLAEVETDGSVHETLRNNVLPTVTTSDSMDDVKDEERFDDNDDDDNEDDDDDDGNDFTLRRKARPNPPDRRRGLTHSKGGVTLNTKGRKKRKDYPSSWGCPPSQMKMKKRVLCVFDGTRRLWKNDMMLDTDFEVRMKLGDEKPYVTDLDVQTMKRADGFLNSLNEDKGPWIADDLTGLDLEMLMEAKRP